MACDLQPPQFCGLVLGPWSTIKSTYSAQYLDGSINYGLEGSFSGMSDSFLVCYTSG